MYLKIKEYIDTPVEQMFDKIEEELLEVLVFYHCYKCQKEYTRYKDLIVNALIAEIHDFIQVIYTFSIILHINIDENRLIMNNLACDHFIDTLRCKVEYIVEKKPTMMKIELSTCIDMAFNLLLKICAGNDVELEDTIQLHIDKMKGRNITIL